MPIKGVGGLTIVVGLLSLLRVNGLSTSRDNPLESTSYSRSIPGIVYASQDSMIDEFNAADTPFARFVVWTSRGFAADWQSEIIYNSKLENAATWRTAADAWSVASRINGCVLELSENGSARLLTLSEVA